MLSGKNVIYAIHSFLIGSLARVFALTQSRVAFPTGNNGMYGSPSVVWWRIGPSLIASFRTSYTTGV